MSHHRHHHGKGLFEHRLEKPIPAGAFWARVGKFFLASASLVLISLGVGVAGYHAAEGFSWTDSFLNAAMILGGMGPVDELRTEAGKLFAGCYALYSGLILILAVGLIFTPLIHRMLHKFHFEEDSDLNR